MNENLNLVEILKDCPKGTKLYSPLFGEVKFEQILENWGYVSVRKGKDTWPFESDARFPISDSKSAELMLYPSKEQRDWSKFNPKKDGLVSTCEFKDGDILSYQCKGFNNRSIYIYRYHKRFNTSYYVALSGDDNEFRIDNTGKWALNGYNDTVRFASEDEKKKLFQAIKDNGYKWNVETKTLETLIRPKFKVGDKIAHRLWKDMCTDGSQVIISEITDDKYILTDGNYMLISNQDRWELVKDKKKKFDPKTLKPFDKVLVRDECYERWRCEFYSYIHDDNGGYPYIVINDAYKHCIPYNEDTKHLVGTTDEAPEYYRYWED